MTEFGYALSSEEHPPLELVRNAHRAEEAGFTFALISDHFHPWVDEQGQSPFVWSVVGGIAYATERLRLGTGVTCPTIRIHPAIVAHAAATCAAIMPGRFFLGVGTGENLNEHVLGDKWPSPDERLEMLAEAIGVIRQLWEGGYQTFRGDYYVVEDAALHASRRAAADRCRRVEAARSAARGRSRGRARGRGARPRDRRDVRGSGRRRAAVRTDPRLLGRDRGRGAGDGVPGLAEYSNHRGPVPGASASPPLRAGGRDGEPGRRRRPDPGPDAEPWLEAVRTYEEAGFDHLYFHQIGPDQAGFLRFWSDELAPRLQPQLHELDRRHQEVV